MPLLSFRAATTDDAPAVEAIYAIAHRRNPASFPSGVVVTGADFARLLQTGNAFLLATDDADRPVAVVRHRDDEGITWFDLLASVRPPAGRALVAQVERGAQDAGIRLVRLRVPDMGVLPEVFARRGYTGISRETEAQGGERVPVLVMEKRLPLLTVREQKRSDAGAIGVLTGEDPWLLEQQARPGWFVASDGERVVGVVSVADGGPGFALISEPVLFDAYRGRRLELWMIERAAYYAETNGYHSAAVPLTATTRRFERDLEDRRWFPDGGRYVRRFVEPPSTFSDDGSLDD